MTAPTAFAIRIVASGGLPIVEAVNGKGLPVTPVLSGGISCTIVTGIPGAYALPVVGSGAAPI